ncbi:MAG TPA: HAMP domain-containing sensor histidine kinase [Candidatus Limnocylindrales bacterium]|nr:HAMP domain-containing sensor histidine kinase [Candidatus Limnocylindrales bacterium]
MRSLRTRLAVTLVALVAATVAAIGLGVYAFVDASLRASVVEDARRQADFNLAVLLPAAQPVPVDAAAFAESGLPDQFRLRGGAEVIAAFPDDTTWAPAPLLGALDEVSPEVRAIVGRGELGYGWQTLGGAPVLVVGGRQRAVPGSPDLFFVFEAAAVENALAQLRLGLVVAGVLAVLLALVTSGLIARGILRPVTAGSRAARRIADGDLAARVPVGGRDELGRWASDFNRMAASLESTVHRLEEAQGQNRRFVADVAHELRTPITALVAEASVLEGQLAGMPPDTRRAAELMVVDVRRLRALVDDLLEISRFDAAAEQLALQGVDLGRLVTSVVAARHPAATVVLPGQPVIVESEPRRLDRILGNLLDNARSHAPGAPVEVSVTPVSSAVVVTVADRGPGVHPDALPHLFDRFYKADPSRGGSAGGSSGLGLAIAAEHTALLGGSLRARNRPGGGLVVALTLPVTGSLPPGDRPDTGRTDAGAMSEPAPKSLP